MPVNGIFDVFDLLAFY
ncbi:hypothetical protein, partial [Escherichia coli]